MYLKSKVGTFDFIDFDSLKKTTDPILVLSKHWCKKRVCGLASFTFYITTLKIMTCVHNNRKYE